MGHLYTPLSTKFGEFSFLPIIIIIVIVVIIHYFISSCWFVIFRVTIPPPLFQGNVSLITNAQWKVPEVCVYKIPTVELSQLSKAPSPATPFLQMLHGWGPPTYQIHVPNRCLDQAWY